MKSRDELLAIGSAARQGAVDDYWKTVDSCTLGESARIARKALEIGDAAMTDAIIAALKEEAA